MRRFTAATRPNTSAVKNKIHSGAENSFKIICLKTRKSRSTFFLLTLQAPITTAADGSLEYRDQTCFFHSLTFARSRGRCRKPRLKAEVFNNSLGIWQTLMHWKTMFDPVIAINSTIMLKKITKLARHYLRPHRNYLADFLLISISIKILVSGHGRLL